MKPNFFIVGAPKCGTTAIAEYLRSHPNVFITKPKEPRYFARELRIRLDEAPPYASSFTEYMKLYDDADPSIHKVVGEASTNYLRCESALEEIRTFYPDSRVLAMVRNPVDLAYSWHGQKLIEGQEVVSNFSVAWDLQRLRSRGEQLPPTLRTIDALLYEKVASVGSQLRTVLDIFPSEQVLIIFYDDLSEDPASTYRRILKFLELAPDERTRFERHRAGVEVRWPLMWRLLNRRPAAMDSAIRVIRRWDRAGWLSRTGEYLRSSLVSQRSRLSGEMRARLLVEFDEEIRILEDLTGRSLARWRVP